MTASQGLGRVDVEVKDLRVRNILLPVKDYASGVAPSHFAFLVEDQGLNNDELARPALVLPELGQGHLCPGIRVVRTDRSGRP